MPKLQEKIAGEEYTFSPLTLGDVRKMDQALKDVESGKLQGLDIVLAFVPFIHKSVSVVHTTVTQQELEDKMTMEDLEPAQRAMLKASGFEAKVKTSGEPLPAAESTGPTSTAA